MNILSMIVGLFLTVSQVWAGAANFDLKTLHQYSRVVIPALPATSITATGSGSTLLIKLNRVSDISKFDLAGLKDSRIKNISVQMKGPDQAEVKVELNSANSDFFAYAQPDPAAVVVDIWQKKSDVPQVASATKKSRVSKVSNKRVIASVKKEEPEPAAEVAPLNADRDIFVRMTLAQQPTELTGGLVATPFKLDLGTAWNFAKPNKKEPDGEAFALALSLFKEKKYGLVIRTLELLRRDYSDSSYLVEADFLHALSLKRLGEDQKSAELVAQADVTLLELANKVDASGKNLPYYKLINLYFTLKEYNADTGIKVVERLEHLLSIWDKNDPEFLKLQMLMAEAYIKISRPRFAERIYRYIVENHPKSPFAAEAAYRTGNLLASERNYDRVIEEGERAIQMYPEHKKKRSELLFNIGEAYFWKRNYAAANKYFKEYVSVSPASTIAAQAYTRMGEIAELHSGNMKLATQEYLRAKNGFPFTLGDQISSLRLARIRITTEKDLSFQIKTLNSVIKDKSTTDTIRRMAQLVLVDYYLAAKDINSAVSLAKDGFVSNTGIAYEGFKKSYAQALLAQIQDLSGRSKFAEALKVYNDSASLLALNGAIVKLAVSEIYRGLGLFESSNQYLAEYEKELASSRGVASVKKAGKVIAEGRAENSYKRGDYSGVLSETASMNKTPVVLAMRAQSFYRSARKIEAYAEAKRAFAALGDARLSMDKAEFTEWYASIADILVEEATQGRNYSDLEKVVSATRKNLFEPLERYEFYAGDVHWYRKEHEAAVAAYKGAIEKYPDGERADRAKYNSAMSLINLKKRDEAVKLLTEVQEKQRPVWSQAAQQELNLLEWEKKYSAVLRGLPPSGLGVVQ